MPHLLVDLENPADCRKATEILKRRLCGGKFQGGRQAKGGQAGAGDVASLPLPQKLKRIQSRGMWKHLVKIANSAEEPLSLPELDQLLDLPKNKMRSLKAIMAKLENRFGIQFLRVDPDGGVDAAGNPRYIMPPNVRRQIRRLSSE